METLLLSSDFQISFKYLKGGHTANKIQSRNSNLIQILESMHFPLLAHKCVNESWKPLPNYFLNLMNRLTVAAGIIQSYQFHHNFTEMACYNLHWLWWFSGFLMGAYYHFGLHFFIYWQDRIFSLIILYYWHFFCC